MANLPVYILDDNAMPRLKVALQPHGLELQEQGGLKANAEGLEQDWKCLDEKGDLFLFGTSQLNEKNALGLQGTLCLVPGPRARGRKSKEVREAFELFERLLIESGGQKLKRDLSR